MILYIFLFISISVSHLRLYRSPLILSIPFYPGRIVFYDMSYGPSFEPIRGLYLGKLTNEKQLWVLTVMRRCLLFLRLLSCHDFRVFMSDLVTRECSVLSRTQVSRAKFWVKSVRSYSRFFSPFSTWDVSLNERTFHCRIHTDLIV